MTTDIQAVISKRPVEEERIFVATQWQLMWWKFRKHKLAMVSGVIMIVLYLIALFCTKKGATGS